MVLTRYMPEETQGAIEVFLKTMELRPRYRAVVSEHFPSRLLGPMYQKPGSARSDARRYTTTDSRGEVLSTNAKSTE